MVVLRGFLASETVWFKILLNYVWKAVVKYRIARQFFLRLTLKFLGKSLWTLHKPSDKWLFLPSKYPLKEMGVLVRLRIEDVCETGIVLVKAKPFSDRHMVILVNEIFEIDNFSHRRWFFQRTTSAMFIFEFYSSEWSMYYWLKLSWLVWKEKAPYEAKAKKRKSDYEKLMKAYNKKQVNIIAFISYFWYIAWLVYLIDIPLFVSFVCDDRRAWLKMVMRSQIGQNPKWMMKMRKMLR